MSSPTAGRGAADEPAIGIEGSMADCIFCSIVAGSAPAVVVREDSRTLALLDRNPAADGHTLVVPTSHAEDIWAISEEAFAAVAKATHAVARLIWERLEPDGVTLFQANRPDRLRPLTILGPQSPSPRPKRSARAPNVAYSPNRPKRKIWLTNFQVKRVDFFCVSQSGMQPRPERLGLLLPAA